MPRVLLLLPTSSFRTKALLSAADRAGAEMTVASEHDSSIGHLNPAGFLTLDFSHPGRCARIALEFAERFPIDAVVGLDDQVAEPAATIGEALGLPHNPPAAVAAARNKFTARRLLSAAGVPCPGFRRERFDGDPQRIGGQVTFPCVVKPLALSASRGVIRADTAGEFVDAVRRLESILRECDDEETLGDAAEAYLVEDFIPGPEVAVEGLLRDGNFELLALFDKPDPLDGPFFEETLFVTPSRLDEKLQARIVETAADAAGTIGLRHGPVHVELRIGPDGPVVIEVNPRSIGGLCSEVLRFGTGLKQEDLVLYLALGDKAPPPPRESDAAGVLMIPVTGTGRLAEVRGVEQAEAVPGIERVTITAHPGQQLRPLPEGCPYPGFVFARAGTPGEVEESLRQAGRLIELDLETADPTEAVDAGEPTHAGVSPR